MDKNNGTRSHYECNNPRRVAMPLKSINQTIEWIHALSQKETQTTLSKIRTRLAESIFSINNCHATRGIIFFFFFVSTYFHYWEFQEYSIIR